MCIDQGRTEPFLMAGLPRYKRHVRPASSRAFPTNVCQSAMDFFKVSGVQGRTGPCLVAGLPRFKAKSGQLLAGLPPTDVCQSTTKCFKVFWLPRHGLQRCRLSSSRPGGAAGAVTPCRRAPTRPPAVPGEQLALWGIAGLSHPGSDTCGGVCALR